MLRMGHCQDAERLDLGMGWLYYGWARLIRPRRVVVIGSYRGFVPLVLGKALHDNGDGGDVWFIDPSLVDDFWKGDVAAHFARFGVTNVRHFLQTTQEFTASDANREMGAIGIAFIDGYHTAEQAQIDFEALAPHVPSSGLVLLHDSIEVGTVNIYGPDRRYERTVRHFVDRLRGNAEWQILDLPYAKGLTVARRNASGTTAP